MKKNLIAYGLGVGSLCLGMTVFAQTAATTQAPAQQGSSASRATEPATANPASPAIPASGAAPTSPASEAGQASGAARGGAGSAGPAGASGTPAMTPSAADVKAADPAAGALPAPQQAGGVTYITGGFGDNQAAAFKEAGAKHSVMMVFSETGGAYLADIPVQIKSKGEGADVDIKAAGPYLLINLPDGNYTAQATHQGKSQSKDFTVSGQKGQRIAFTW